MGSPTDSPLLLPKGLVDGAALYARAFAEAFRPDPVYTVSQWADERRVLSSMSTAEHGRWRTSRTPYLREIMDCLSPSHPVREVDFMKGTQIGGSEAGYNWMGSIIDLWPAPTMLVMPTTETGERISKQRITPMINESPTLRAKVAEAKSRSSGNTVSMKEFRGGVLVIAGANSGAGLRSMPVRFLMMDEVDAYPSDVDGEGDPCKVAEKRTEAFVRHKIFRCSSPKEKSTSRIGRYYEASDQRRYHVPCPHCAHEQWLQWGQIRWETRKVWEVTRADDGEIVEVEAETEGATERDTGELVRAWYECEGCQGEILEHHKAAMLAAGRWIAMRPGPSRHPGFHLSALYSPFGVMTWEKAVRERLEADRDLSGELLKTWTNTVLGEPYDERGDQPDENELKAHVGEYRVGGPVPRGALLLTCGVDVQHDRLEARVWGWGRGDESWLIAREIIHGSPFDDSTWRALEELLFRGWAHEGGSTVKITATAIDAGDGNTTHPVRMFCRKWAHKHVIATKGQAVQGKPILGKPTEQDVNHRGRVIKGGVKLWPLGSDTAKSLIYARYRIETPGPGYVHLPQGLPDEAFAQMTAEKLVTKFVKGFPKREWTKDAGARNEDLDCFAMALAAAHYAGVTRVNWDRLEALLIQPDLFIASSPADGPSSAPSQEDASPPGEDARPDPPPRSIAAPRKPASSGLFVGPRNFATSW